MEFAFDEAVLAASEENFSNEQLGTISGKW